MKRRTLIWVLAWLASCEANAQENYAEYEVVQISFSGNRIVKSDELSAVIQSKEAPSWLWKSLYKISESVGKKPEYFDPSVFAQDVNQLRGYYKSNGFFHAVIDTSVSINPDEKTVSLTFKIDEGYRSRIDTLRYVGLDNLPRDLQDGIKDHKLVEVGGPFVEQKIIDEQQRVISFFANHGYVQVHASPPRADGYASTNNVSVTFTFSSGNRYEFGAIHVVSDSTVKQRVEDAVILRNLDFKTGDFFNLAAKIESERNLIRLGVFETAKIEEMGIDSTGKSLEIPIEVFVRPRSFYELSPEVGVNDDRGYTNVYFGLGYDDRSFFGGGRTFTSRIRINVHSFQDLDLVRAFRQEGLRDSTVLTNADLTLNFVQPYFINNKTSLTTTLFAAMEKQRTYYSPIFRVQVGTATQTATYTRAFIDWNLEAINPHSIITNTDTALGTQHEFKTQFNSILSFTLQRDKRNDLFSPSSGFFQSGSIEEAGIVPSIIHNVFRSELPYAKYVKFTALSQWYWDPGETRTLIWATRLRVGAAQLYGESPATVPITRRFFVGGSGSVRGWSARTLGEVKTPDEGGSALVEASLESRWSPLKDAGNLWFFETKKLSFVFFYDVGNIWEELRKVAIAEIAMAAGVGLRYETVAGPIRIDFGWRVYDPAAPLSTQWITNRRFVPDVLPNFVFHLGVGQAF